MRCRTMPIRAPSIGFPAGMSAVGGIIGSRASKTGNHERNPVYRVWMNEELPSGLPSPKAATDAGSPNRTGPAPMSRCASYHLNKPRPSEAKRVWRRQAGEPALILHPVAIDGPAPEVSNGVPMGGRGGDLPTDSGAGDDAGSTLFRQRGCCRSGLEILGAAGFSILPSASTNRSRTICVRLCDCCGPTGPRRG